MWKIVVHVKRVGVMLYKKIRRRYVEFIIIVSTILSYLLSKDPVLGYLILLECFIFVGIEIRKSERVGEIKYETSDAFIGIGIAFGLWMVFSLALNSVSPFAAVSSCSMYPELNIGDLIIIQGGNIKGLTF